MVMRPSVSWRGARGARGWRPADWPLLDRPARPWPGFADVWSRS